MVLGIANLIPLAETRVFGQTFELHDLVIVGLLCVLEGILSIDNALVLVRFRELARLPPSTRLEDCPGVGELLSQARA